MRTKNVCVLPTTRRQQSLYLSIESGTSSGAWLASHLNEFWSADAVYEALRRFRTNRILHVHLIRGLDSGQTLVHTDFLISDFKRFQIRYYIQSKFTQNNKLKVNSSSIGECQCKKSNKTLKKQKKKLTRSLFAMK